MDGLQFLLFVLILVLVFWPCKVTRFTGVGMRRGDEGVIVKFLDGDDEVGQITLTAHEAQRLGRGLMLYGEAADRRDLANGLHQETR